MTKRRTGLLHRGLALLLALVMCMSLTCVTAFAADVKAYEADYLGVPSEVEDGVYYATINLKMATDPDNRYSMGNSALRGSKSFVEKHTEDKDYRPIVIVKDGKATALVEFMPMGFLGTYGCMLELEGVYPGSFTYGAPNAKDPNTVFTSTRTLTLHKTTDGKVVYDPYNDPASESKFDGTKERPAGYGKETSYPNIVDQPYSHLLAIDVTPVSIKWDDYVAPTTAAEYTGENAAFCHVFVPVMFSISPSSGDQYARIQVDWENLDKIEDPESNVQYMLYQASQTDTTGCPADAVSAFNAAYDEVHTALENIWPGQQLDLDSSNQPMLNQKTYTEAEQAAMAKKLQDAITALHAADTTALSELVTKAKAVDGSKYTAESYQAVTDAIAAAEALLANSDATQEQVDAQVAALQAALDALQLPVDENGWDGVTVKEPAVSASGSVDVTCAEELAWLAQQVNSGKTFTLVNLESDIDLNNRAWTAIGTKDHPFTGEFYGWGHTVSGLNVDATGSYQGLFGCVKGTEDASAIISDLTVKGSVSTKGLYVGGVVGSATYTKLENVTNEADVTAESVSAYNNGYVGGVAGEVILGSVTHSANTGKISAEGQQRVGGVAGYVSNSYVTKTANSGAVTGGSDTGGIVGAYVVRGGSKGLIQCYNTGDVSGTGTNVGGIVGNVTSTGDNNQGVYGSLYNRGNVTAQHTAGGLFGAYSGGNLSLLSAAYSTGKVTITADNESYGALIGKMYSGMFYTSFAETGTSDQLYSKGTSSAIQLISGVSFQDSSWFKSDAFFTALGSSKDNFAEDATNINGGYPILKFQLDDLLQQAKNDAIAELVAYKDVNSYKGLSKEAVKQVKSDAITAINSAATTEEVAQLLEKAKADLDAIPNDANYGLDLTALKEKLAQAKELEAKGGDLYTEDSWNSFTATIAGIDYLLDSGFGTQEKVDTYLGYLTGNMDKLTYREADYTAVDEAIASIPADLSGYTNETVKAVEDAKNAVVRGKDITQQEQVDAMAAAIRDAVSKLEKKKDDGALDFANLEDGVYSIDFTMVKMNRTDLSMSNDAVNHTAKLTVKDGKYTLTVNFKGLHYLNRFGYLAKLSYYDDGYTYGQYGAVNGTLLPATVLSYQKNADGTDVKDEFNVPGGSAEGMLYPQTISFPLVDTARQDADGFVPLHVFVPVMEDISEGSGDQDVLMKLDRTTLKKTDENDPSFEPEKPEELSPAVDYTDPATGLRVQADKGTLPEGVQIVVTEVKQGAAYDSASKELESVGRKFRLYDVKFLDKDGNEVTPNGTVTLSVPVPAGYDSAKVALYRLADGKTMVRGTMADGCYTAVTKTGGSYALVESGSTVTDGQNTADKPQTGESGIMTYALLAVAAMGAAGVTVVCAKRKNEMGE